MFIAFHNNCLLLPWFSLSFPLPPPHRIHLSSIPPWMVRRSFAQARDRFSGHHRSHSRRINAGPRSVHSQSLYIYAHNSANIKTAWKNPLPQESNHDVSILLWKWVLQSGILVLAMVYSSLWIIMKLKLRFYMNIMCDCNHKKLNLK